MKQKKRTGDHEPKLRRAGKEHRDHAATLASAYRAGQIAGDDLAAMLEWFAKHGTFDQLANHREFRADAVRFHFAKLRAAGQSYENARFECAELFHCSETTVSSCLNDSPTAKT